MTNNAGDEFRRVRESEMARMARDEANMMRLRQDAIQVQHIKAFQNFAREANQLRELGTLRGLAREQAAAIQRLSETHRHLSKLGEPGSALSSLIKGMTAVTGQSALGFLAEEAGKSAVRQIMAGMAAVREPNSFGLAGVGATQYLKQTRGFGDLTATDMLTRAHVNQAHFFKQFQMGIAAASEQLRIPDAEAFAQTIREKFEEQTRPTREAASALTPPSPENVIQQTVSVVTSAVSRPGMSLSEKIALVSLILTILFKFFDIATANPSEAREWRRLAEHIEAQILASQINSDTARTARDTYVVERSVLLRRKPNTKRPAIGKLDTGELVFVLGKHGHWVFVIVTSAESETRAGWVMKKYLSRSR